MRVPGGARGPTAQPSREAVYLPTERPGGYVFGGANGAVDLFTPAINNTAPFIVNTTQGHWNRRDIEWLRRPVPNVAGRDNFVPVNDGTTSWTSNAVQAQASRPSSPIPFSSKLRNSGGLRRGFNFENQLYTQLTRSPLQRAKLIARQRSQPQISPPSQPRLADWIPAGAYGQTTRKLNISNVTNALSGAPSMGGSDYAF
jgi:hypothetical protein